MPAFQTPQPPSSPPTQPKPIVMDVSKGYSSVNKLSLLPDEVRTEENLEGNTIPFEKQDELLERYNKERAEYEENQLQKCEGVKAPKGEPQPNPITGAIASLLSTSLPLSSSSAGKDSKVESMVADRTLAYYDSVELPSHTTAKDDHFHADMETYTQPADALLLPVINPVTKKPKISPEMQKNIIVDTSGAGHDYTPVVNTLPAGQVERVGPMRPTRVSSDSGMLRYKYENSTVTPEGGRKEEEIGKRQDVGRSSNRRAAKEEVEFDPRKQRMFRMTSKKSKRGGEEEPDGGGVNGNLDSSPGSQGGDSTESDKEAAREEVAVQGRRGSAAMAYAMVNMGDKRKNRVETDVVKCEGSGIPQHYVVPVLSS